MIARKPQLTVLRVALGLAISASSAIADKIDATSSRFAWTLANDAKVHYEERRWSEFFGLAAYLRRTFPKHPDVESIRALEALALLRHCQWDEAKKRLAEILPVSSPALRAELTRVADALGVAPELPSEETPSDKTADAGTMSKASRWWPVSSLDLSKLDPHKLRRDVSPKCEGVLR